MDSWGTGGKDRGSEVVGPPYYGAGTERSSAIWEKAARNQGNEFRLKTNQGAMNGNCPSLKRRL